MTDTAEAQQLRAMFSALGSMIHGQPVEALQGLRDFLLEDFLPTLDKEIAARG